jgi:hypothetical protein
MRREQVDDFTLEQLLLLRLDVRALDLLHYVVVVQPGNLQRTVR